VSAANDRDSTTGQRPAPDWFWTLESSISRAFCEKAGATLFRARALAARHGRQRRARRDFAAGQAKAWPIRRRAGPHRPQALKAPEILFLKTKIHAIFNAAVPKPRVREFALCPQPKPQPETTSARKIALVAVKKFGIAKKGFF
jgi:hypothetical protein